MKQNLKAHLENQLRKESHFQEYLPCLVGMPPGIKRKALARSKRRAYLVEQLLQLV